MKYTKSILSLFFLFSIAKGTVTVDWTMPDEVDEVLRSDATTLLPSNSVWQLIWSPDNTISAFNSLNPFQVHSSETLLEEYRNPDAGYIFGQGGNYVATNYSLPEDTFVGGYVYTRVFDYQGSTSVFNLIDLDGMKFIESGFSGPLQDTDTDQGPAGFATSHVPFSGTNVVDQTFVVPEPTTIAIMLMGILGLLGYRKHLAKR